MTTVSDFGSIPKSVQLCTLEVVGTSTGGTGGHIRATGNVGVRGTVDLGGLKVTGNDFVLTSQLLGRTYHNAIINSSALGSNVMFTVPVGKKAKPLTMSVFNPTGSPATFYSEWNFGSGFVRWNVDVTVAANGSSATNSSGDILEAGQSVSINTSVATLTASIGYLLFASTELAQTYRVLMSTTKQTLFTCPAGKVAVTSDNINGFVSATTNIRFVNTTGNTPTITVTLETSTTPETTIHRAAGINANNITTFQYVFLKAGDIIRVVSSTNDAVYAAVNVTLLDQ